MELLYNIKSKKQDEPVLTKIYLEVPFKLKDELKQFGIKWDNICKKWYYVDNNNNIDKINIIIENYKKLSTTNKKIYIYLPFKLKDEARKNYNGIQFDKEAKQWYIYDNNINKNEIIDTYHKGNF